MIEQLLDSRPALALAIGLLSAINYVVARVALAQQARQTFVEYGNEDVREPGTQARADHAGLARPFIVTAIVIASTFVTDRFVRELLGGGWLVMQIASLGLTTADVLSTKALRRPDAAAGRIRYSAAHRQRVAAARAFGMAVVTAAVGLLFSSRAFAMGALLLLATGVGWHRRARRRDVSER